MVSDEGVVPPLAFVDEFVGTTRPPGELVAAVGRVLHVESVH